MKITHRLTFYLTNRKIPVLAQKAYSLNIMDNETEENKKKDLKESMNDDMQKLIDELKI